MKAEVGQIWASNDHRDIRLGARQRREITAIYDGRAYLHTEGGTHSGSFGVKLDANGGVLRHRFVENLGARALSVKLDFDGLPDKNLSELQEDGFTRLPLETPAGSVYAAFETLGIEPERAQIFFTTNRFNVSVGKPQCCGTASRTNGSYHSSECVG
jgi:hypothetical protein